MINNEIYCMKLILTIDTRSVPIMAIIICNVFIYINIDIITITKRAIIPTNPIIVINPVRIVRSNCKRIIH